MIDRTRTLGIVSRSMNEEKQYRCPVCGKQVDADHFACHSGARGGSATGESKRRSAEFYERLSRLGVLARKKKKP